MTPKDRFDCILTRAFFNIISVRVKLQLGVVCCLLIILDAYSCCRYDIHERQVGELARQLGFTQVSLSSEVMPMVRIVPRGYTGIHQNSSAEISTYFKVNGYFFRGSNFCKSQLCCPSLWESTLNPIALRKAKIVGNFGLSECNRDLGKTLLLWEKILSFMS